MRPAAPRIDLGLGAVCCTLLAVFLYQCFAPLPEFDLPKVSPPELRRVPEAPPFMAPAQATFAAIDARPIFNPGRQPIESTAVAGNAAVSAPPNVALVGVILDSKNQLALVRSEGAPFATSIAVGETISGWEVIEITPEQVLLRSGVHEFMLRMDSRRAAQPSQPNSAMAAPRGPVMRARPAEMPGTSGSPYAGGTVTRRWPSTRTGDQFAPRDVDNNQNIRTMDSGGPQ